MSRRLADLAVLIGVIAAVAGCSAQKRPGRPASVSARVASSGGWSTVTSGTASLDVAGGTSGLAIRGDSVLVGLSFAAALNSQGGPVSCVNAVPTAGYTVAGGVSGGLSAPRALGLNIDAGPVASGAAVVALVSTPGQLTADCATPEILRVADLSPLAGATSRAVLQPMAVIDDARIAGNARGDLAATWLVVAGSAPGRAGHAALRLYLQSAGAPSGRTVNVAAQPLGSGFGGRSAVAIDARGNALIAYSTPNAAFAVTVTPGGMVTRRQTLGRCDAACNVVAAGAPNGRAVVVWDSQSITGDGAVTPYVVRAAFRDTPGGPFAPARIVDPGGIVDDQQAGPPVVAIAPNGRAIVEWANLAPRNAQDFLYTVRAAIAPPNATFGPIIALGDGAPGSVAIRPDGATLATWVQTPNPNQSEGPVRASLTPPGAKQAAAVSLPGSPTGFDPIGAFTPAGRAIVAWTATGTTTKAVAISTHDSP